MPRDEAGNVDLVRDSKSCLCILRFYVCLNLLTAGPFDLTPIPLSSFKFFLAFGGEFGGRLLDRIVLLPLFVDLV